MTNFPEFSSEKLREICSGFYLEDAMPGFSSCFLMTPKLAREILNEYNYPHQRRVRRDRVERYKLAILNNMFRALTSIDFDVFAGRPFLVNGQHTLNAIAESGLTIPLSVVIKPMTSMEAIEKDYALFDINGVRTIYDSTGSLPHALGMSDRQTVQLIRSSIYIYRGLIQYELSSEEKKHLSAYHSFGHQLAISWANEGIQYANILSKAFRGNRELLVRKGVLAFALLTLRYQPEKAVEFWKTTSADNGLLVGSPQKTLLQWLTTNAASGTTLELQFPACVLAWNKFFKGQSLTKLVALNGKKVDILGVDLNIQSTFRYRDDIEFNPQRNVPFEFGGSMVTQIPVDMPENQEVRSMFKEEVASSSVFKDLFSGVSLDRAEALLSNSTTKAALVAPSLVSVKFESIVIDPVDQVVAAAPSFTSPPNFPDEDAYFESLGGVVVPIAKAKPVFSSFASTAADADKFKRYCNDLGYRSIYEISYNTWVELRVPNMRDAYTPIIDYKILLIKLGLTGTPAEVLAKFQNRPTELKSTLRWMLRGLPVRHAITKVLSEKLSKEEKIEFAESAMDAPEPNFATAQWSAHVRSFFKREDEKGSVKN